MIRTGHGPENKKKERPRGGRSHVNTGRDDKIGTCDPLLPKQKRSFRSLCAYVPERDVIQDRFLKDVQKKPHNPGGGEWGHVSMGFLGGYNEELCSVGKYLTRMVRYVKRKIIPIIEVYMRQVRYQAAL